MERNDQAIQRAIENAARISAGRGVFFRQTVANRLGINTSDLNCLNILQLAGPLTAGQLAERAGLTRGGAITAALDRMERAGLIERERDPGDRRRTIVRHTQEAIDRIAPLMPAEPWRAVYEHFTDAELRIILEYTQRSSEAARISIEKLQGT
ncbi:MarR family transcriptional regulator [Kibdelosporangium philippinense]|uniref:MarR family transcriptional regulator n=1 Tax=Kibdelosporangium philippinense TaxID=211113 RepID=A0ABS8ZCE9_9PSEU|nr:MarR family transcriptional regulator [Kibdelosporangium philippinense]MCE7005541.1 MarR family transcriptional regulator [Kibdelosporangium philippinense]